MEYAFRDIEQKWKKYWNDNKVYKVSNNSPKPKFYILDMFPYPSGAGLHVGHPLGYIASDIYARYKRLSGYNVLHPMGYDAFGLPAEQYAIETGQHPAVTTEKNIARYREQLDNIGFCFDWDREVRTSDPKYYKWTQWIFLQLFHSWYDRKENKARNISTLIEIFDKEGNINTPSPGNAELNFDADDWEDFSEKEKRDVLMAYRLAYLSFAEVWWCEALGTVLANDEVVNGVSERGGHPVEKKRMRQWFLRITEYADRLLEGLNGLDWSEAMKEMQRNWIGKSMGAEVTFDLSPALSEGEGGVAQDPQEAGWNTAEPSLYGLIGEYRKDLKNNPTEAENILWKFLKAKQLGAKFRRQHVVGRYIADFICLSKKLIIEVDGKIHQSQQDEDAQRTEYLNEKGYKVIRFTNEQIIADIDSVVEKIDQVLKAPSPSERAGGEVGIKVFTTRPDTIFGVDFMVLAPEHELVDEITTEKQRQAVNEYKQYVKSRSERERMTEVKQVTGCFTGAYAMHPLTEKEIPIWISEYVLAGYSTGAIMGVPSGDERDHAFAKHFDLPITNIFGEKYNGENAYSEKTGKLENSGFLNGVEISKAIDIAIAAIADAGKGRKRVNYRLRDAGFSRQRYWGEPFPIIYVDDVPYGNDEAIFDAYPELKQLPVELPKVDTYSPGPEGQGPLANLKNWVETSDGLRETNTMPGYAGSSWYFLRYMDLHNDEAFADRKAIDYWKAVDIYIGGSEHAVGHLLYSRMWTKALYDLGLIGFDEPFKKLINQGMIQGSSRFVRLNRENKTFYTFNLTEPPIGLGKIETLRVDISIVDGTVLDIEAFKKWRPEYIDFKFELDKDGKFYCGAEIEKMSKSKYNVVNPDDMVNQYGADTFRMYEMFLGPVEMSKPWDTKGIEGVHRFLKKMWRLYNDEQSGSILTDEAANEAELRILHKTIKKVGEDIERFSFNTSVSQFMICVNELTALNCHKREVLEQLAVLICPFAPHFAEELWHQLGHNGSVMDASFPRFEEKYVTENSKKYPVAVNGKTRVELEFALDAEQSSIEKEVLADPTVIKWLEGKAPKKVIYVKGKMINVVV